MKKLLTAAAVLLLGGSIAIAQNPVTAGPSPTPGTATAEEVVVQSQELDISLVTGALPAQFGFRTTGVIDIHTKNGAVFQQGEASVYGGSFDTIMPSFEYGGVAGKLNYYVIANYLHDGIGIENPTRSSDPI